MENTSFDEIESKYSELSQLNNSDKSNVYLVQSAVDGKIYIKKELKNYNIDVYKEIINIENLYMANIYEIFKCDDSLIVIEEFINGNTLQWILDNEGPLNEHSAISYMIKLCAILDKLHSLNPPVIHRDIKPSNIIIDNNDILKLIDFDVSRVYKEESNLDTHILGTKGYAPPEQFGFEQTDCRSDIYSIGVMLNVLTTGKHIKEQVNQGKLKEIIEKCTNISPDNRYSSVKELKEVLQNILTNDSEEHEVPMSNNTNINTDVNRNNTIDVNSNVNNYQSFYNKDNLSYNNIIDKDKEKPKTEDYVITRDYIENNIGSREHEDNNKRNIITNILSIIKDLPGYKGKNPLYMVLATLWYAFLTFGFFMNFGTGDIKSILEDVLVASLLFSLTLFNGNYKNIKDKLPLTRSNKSGERKAGIIIYNLVIVIAFGIFL